MDHIASLLLGLGAGGVYAALGAGAGDHLPRLGRRELRDRGDGAVRGLHLRRPPQGRAHRAHPGAAEDRRPRRGAGVLAGRGHRHGRRRRARGGALRGGVPPAARRAPAGQGGGVARRPRGAAGRAGHPAGDQPRDGRPHLPGRALGARRDRRPLRSLLPGADGRRPGARAGGGVPLHPLRAAHPGDGGVADRRLRQRRLARPRGAAQLDDQRHGGRASPASSSPP